MMNTTRYIVASLFIGAAMMCAACESTPTPPPASPTAATAPATAKPPASPGSPAAASGAPAASMAMADIMKLPGAAKWKDKKDPVPDDAASVAKGKEIFAKNCATCHGDTGSGDGPAGAALDPKPRNFHTEGFKYGGEDWQLMRTIMEGAPPPSGMVGWNGRMPDQDGWTVIRYVKSLKGK